MTLSRTEFLKCSALLPVILPIAGTGVAVALWMIGIAIPRWIESALEFGLGAVFYFAPLYGLTIVPLLLLLIGRSFRVHVAAALIAPVVMALVTTGVFWVLSDDPLFLGDLAVTCVKAGYTYVAIAFAGLFLGRRAGWIRDEEAQPGRGGGGHMAPFPHRDSLGPGCVLVLLAVCAGCSSEGAARLRDQLMWAANRMNAFGEDTRDVLYRHDRDVPYWIVAAPPGTRADNLRTDGLPASVVDALRRCLQEKQPVLAVMDAEGIDCVYPVSFPEVHELFAVHKQPRQSTTARITRAERRALRLAALQ